MMKNLFTLMIAPLLILTFIITSCKTEDEKEKNGKENTEMVSEDERKKLEEDKEKMRGDLVENQRRINEFRETLKEATDEVKEASRKTLIKVEERNEALRIRLEAFGEKTQEEWEEFKKEFKKDMTALGEAIVDLTTKTDEETKDEKKH